MGLKPPAVTIGMRAMLNGGVGPGIPGFISPGLIPIMTGGGPTGPAARNGGNICARKEPGAGGFGSSCSIPVFMLADVGTVRPPDAGG